MILDIFWTVSLIKSPRVLRWSWVLKNCEILHFEPRSVWQKQRLIVLFLLRCGALKKRMVCTHPDLLARICKLVERKTFGLTCFPRLIYCDQEPLLLLNVTEDYFWGVHISLYQLEARFVSLQNHLAFPSKVTWMCP